MTDFHWSITEAKEKRMNRGTNCLPSLAVGRLAASQRWRLVSGARVRRWRSAGRLAWCWVVVLGLVGAAAGLTVGGLLTRAVRSCRSSLPRKLLRAVRLDRACRKALVEQSPAEPGAQLDDRWLAGPVRFRVRLPGEQLGAVRPSAVNGTAVPGGVGGVR